MRFKHTYVFATALCALALILVCPSHARAGAGKASAPQPGSSQMLRPDAVDCVFVQEAAGTSVHAADMQRTKAKPLEKTIELAPGQDPPSACPPGSKLRGFSYDPGTITAALRNGRIHLESTEYIPPSGKPPPTGAEHPP